MDINKYTLPTTATIAITEMCNSRCTFCNIWGIEKPKNIDVDLIDKLPISLRNINITGGEPLLHKEFALIINKLLQRRCNIIVNTNGIVPLRKYDHLWKRRGIGIRLSLDGIGDVHDSLRGIKGNYKSVIKQVEYLKSIGVSNIGISSTFSDSNINQAMAIYALSRELKVEFTFMVVGNSEIYYKKEDNNIINVGKVKEVLKEIIKQEIRTFKIAGFGKAVYLSELIEFVAGNIKTIRCPAGSKFFFMNPEGTIYVCNMVNLKMGNLNNKSFNEIWYSDESDKLRILTDKCRTPCWTMCNAKPIILNNKVKYFLKFSQNILRNKKIEIEKEGKSLFVRSVD